MVFFTQLFIDLQSMDNLITEVHITFIVLMGLATLYLTCVHPILIKENKTYRVSRILLAIGTFSIVLHFIVQYAIHKRLDDPAELRTQINLVFGIPIAYFFNLSFLYLFRQKEIGRAVWYYAPMMLILAIITLLLPTKDHIPTILIWCMYASTLVYYALMMLLYYLRDKKAGMIENEPLALKPFLQMTRRSLFIMVIMTFTFPLMTFSPNLFYRSLCGLLSLSICTFCILGFTFLGIKGYNTIGEDESQADLKNQTDAAKKERLQMSMSTERRERMDKAVEEFIQGEHYLQASITLKEAADLMNVSCNMLQIWLKSTEYQKFNNWITTLRIEKSKELILKYPEMTNEEIAERCGFCDRQYFSRQFSKQEGVTPSKWLKDRMND